MNPLYPTVYTTNTTNTTSPRGTTWGTYARSLSPATATYVIPRHVPELVGRPLVTGTIVDAILSRDEFGDIKVTLNIVWPSGYDEHLATKELEHLVDDSNHAIWGSSPPESSDDESAPDPMGALMERLDAIEEMLRLAIDA